MSLLVSIAGSSRHFPHVKLLNQLQRYIVTHPLFRTSLAHSIRIPMVGKMTSSVPLTNREARMGTAPAKRMAWIFLGLLLQLHKAMHALWVSPKLLSTFDGSLVRFLFSGWIMFTWNRHDHRKAFKSTFHDYFLSNFRQMKDDDRDFNNQNT